MIPGVASGKQLKQLFLYFHPTLLGYVCELITQKTQETKRTTKIYLHYIKIEFSYTIT